MIRKYLTYTRIPVFDGERKQIRQRIDPQSTMNDLWPMFNFRETWAMGEKVDDPRIIAVVDYDETVISQELFDRMMNNMSFFGFVLKDVDWVTTHMNLWYGEGNWIFDDNNVFKDLREEELL